MEGDEVKQKKEDFKVYIGRIPQNTTREDIEELFANFGPISNCKLYGLYGFIEFVSYSRAKNAVEALNKKEYQGTKLIVEFAKQAVRGPPRRGDYRLSVTGLPPTVSWQNVKQVFSTVADVVFVEVFYYRGATIG